MPKFEFHFHDKVGAQIAHVDTFIANFDKDMNMQVMNVDEWKDNVQPLSETVHEAGRSVTKPQPSGETFAKRTKAIMQKAATKNGQRIESRAKGHVGSYTYYINADAFCRAMDVLEKDHADQLSEFLGGDLNNTQVTKVCFFIGHVVRMNMINDSNLQITDLLFAFEDFYPNKLTVRKKLSDCSSTSEQRLLLNLFLGYMKHKKS